MMIDMMIDTMIDIICRVGDGGECDDGVEG